VVDGKRIAFVRGPEVEEYTGIASSVYVVDSNGGEEKRRRGIGVGWWTQITWAPSSDRLAFTASEEGVACT
jgi:Tol biopolymer transport system component